MILFTLNAALAGGFFHADDIAEKSAQFAQAASASAPLFEARTVESRALAEALRGYETALDLLGERAPTAERERQDALTLQFNRDRVSIEGFVNTLMTDFDAAFQAALDRALVAEEATDAVECPSLIPKGRPLPGLPQRYEQNPDCTGKDLNATLAAVMDQDPVLQRSLAEISARTWPSFEGYREPQAPVGDGAWIDTLPFFQALAAPHLTAIALADDEARIPIQAALEEGADPASLVSQGRAITAQTRASRSALGDPVFTALDAVGERARKRGGSAFAWCANPIPLGGCSGGALSEAETVMLLKDRKVLRAIP